MLGQNPSVLVWQGTEGTLEIKLERVKSTSASNLGEQLFKYLAFNFLSAYLIYSVFTESIWIPALVFPK